MRTILGILLVATAVGLAACEPRTEPVPSGASTGMVVGEVLDDAPAAGAVAAGGAIDDVPWP